MPEGRGSFAHRRLPMGKGESILRALRVFHEKANVKADVAANRFYDQTPAGLASIRTHMGSVS